jgi:hypothetical protein
MDEAGNESETTLACDWSLFRLLAGNWPHGILGVLQQYLPNSEVAPLFNRLVDRRSKRGHRKIRHFSRAHQPGVHHKSLLLEKSGSPYGHRPRMQRA